MVMKNIFTLLVLIIALSSCKKASERSCFKSKGEDGTLELLVDQKIDSLKLYDDLYYTLVQSAESKVVLSGGENLLPHVEIVADNGNRSEERRVGKECRSRW